MSILVSLHSVATLSCHQIARVEQEHLHPGTGIPPKKRPKKRNFAYLFMFFGPGTGPKAFSRP